MKGIKQKDQDFVETNIRLEAVVDGIIYNPRYRRRIQKRHKSGVYLKRFRRWRNIFRKKFGSISDLKLHFTGVSHLDAAWLFPVVDTKERAFKTFYKAVEHCDLYPFLTFSQTTPQYYDWIKHYSPSLWSKVKEKVGQNRIELTGGMWIEPDLDMPSGESLVRQRLYGQLFFLREFGKMPRMSSLLDVFGFPWSLPQILVKSGADSFWTTKIMVNHYFPTNHFYWKGIDGTEIFTYLFTYNWDALTNTKRFREMARHPAKGKEKYLINSHFQDKEIKALLSNNKKDFINNFAVFYGLGDGGRGPLEIEILYADALKRLHNGHHGSQHEFIRKMKDATGNRYLIWNDEMYLEWHRGTKTTQNAVKHWNRRLEISIPSLEILLTMFSLDLLKSNNDSQSILNSSYKKYIFSLWQRLMFNQFHDILPGSSIPDVYQLAIKEQKEATAEIKYLISSLLSKIPHAENEIIVFNPFNWKRSEYFFIDQVNKWVYIKEIPPLSIKKLKINEISIPNLTLSKSAISTLNNYDTSGQSGDSINNLDYFIIKTERFIAKISKSHGGLVSLKILSNEIELIDPKLSYDHNGSGFRFYHEDPPNWDAWNLDPKYPLKRLNLSILDSPKEQIDEYGARKITTKFVYYAKNQDENSYIDISFWAFPKDEYLRMDIHTDIRTPQILLKYFIPLALDPEYSSDVVSQIPYAAIARKRVPKTEMEKAKWEMNMQQWIDISEYDTLDFAEINESFPRKSDAKYGLSILNNNRYAFRATKKGIYLTITRTPRYPGVSPLYGSTRTLPKDKRPKFTDMIPFDYSFALFPHLKDWRYAKTPQKAAAFNHPLSKTNNLTESKISLSKKTINKLSILLNQLEINNGSTSKSFLNESLFSLVDKHNNIFITTIKPPERNKNGELVENKNWDWDGKTIVLRVVEQYGISTDVELKINYGLAISSAVEANLLEMNDKNDTNPHIIHIKDMSIIEFSINPWEIKTFLIEIKKS